MSHLTQDGLAPVGAPRIIAVLAYGALPLLLMTVHPAEAAPVLAALGGVSVPGMEYALHGTAWLLRIWVAAFGFAALAVAGRDTTVTLLTPSFRIVAALTLPHMIVTTWLEGGDGPGGTMEHE